LQPTYWRNSVRKLDKLVMALGGLAAATVVMAQDVGRVISSNPVVQLVAVPRQICSNQQVEVQRPTSGAGALIGAIAGAALGNASGGRRSERATASAVGAIGGAILGNHIEGSGETQVRDVQRCGTQTTYENRAVGYNVVYEFGGKQYSVQLAQDPGPALPLQVTPVGSANQAPQNYNAVQSPPQVVYAASPVVVNQPIYQGYYPQRYYVRPYVSPIRVDLQFGTGGWHGRRHRHWD
jgi:uncharacterized protein YcfJ